MKVVEAVKSPFFVKSADFLKRYYEKALLNNSDSEKNKIEFKRLVWESDLELCNLIKDELSSSSLVRLDPVHSEAFLNHYGHSSDVIRRMGCADALVKHEGFWWPRFFLFDAMKKVLIGEGRSHDFKQAAYIVGEGALLRSMVNLVAQIGFAKIFLVSEDSADCDSQVKFLSQQHFGISMEVLSADSLTMQTTGTSLLINTCDLTVHPALATDLAYFNFMTTHGWVVDLGNSYTDNISPLLSEAQKAGLNCADTEEIYLQAEVLALESIGISSAADLEQMRQIWREP